jgi:hypothetical protein
MAGQSDQVKWHVLKQALKPGSDDIADFVTNEFENFLSVINSRGKLDTVSYPFKYQQSTGIDDEENAAEQQDVETWATTVSCRIPDGVFIHSDSAKVVAWDSETNDWTSEGIDTLEFKLGECLVSRLQSNSLRYACI